MAQIAKSLHVLFSNRKLCDQINVDGDHLIFEQVTTLCCQLNWTKLLNKEKTRPRGPSTLGCLVSEYQQRISFQGSSSSCFPQKKIKVTDKPQGHHVTSVHCF